MYHIVLEQHLVQHKFKFKKSVVNIVLIEIDYLI